MSLRYFLGVAKMSIYCAPIMREYRFFWVVIVFIFAGCNYTIQIRDGDTAWQQMQYAHAIGLYQKEMKKAKSRVAQGRIALKIADCYTRQNMPEQALPYYQQAWNNQAGISALRGKAATLKMLERYEEAIEIYRQLGEEIGSRYEFRKDIQSCSLAMKWMADNTSPHYQIEVTPFSSRYSDYAAYPFSDQGILFVSDKPTPGNKVLYQWTGRPYSSIYFHPSEGKQPSQIVNAALSQMNGPFNDGPFQTDRWGHLYFTRCGDDAGQRDQFCRIYHSIKEDNTFKEAEVLPFCNGDFNYGHPTFTADGQMMIFTSNDPGGYGGYDLYIALRTQNGWADPALLPATINTAGDEMFPWMDGDTLYFASDGHPGMGGLDIFKTWRTNMSSWSIPENMLPPINSGADDFAFLWDNPTSSTDLRKGFFSSSRPGGAGLDDIYRIAEIIPPPPDTIQETITEFTYSLDIYVLTKILQDANDPNSPVLGRKLLKGATIRQSSPVSAVYTSQEDEPLQMAIQPDQRYEFEVSAPGFLTTRAFFDATGITPDLRYAHQSFELEILLNQIFIEQEIILENIYYDFDKWDIRPDAMPALLRLATLLTDNPDIQIELASHTDCRGTTTYNQDLSQKRAESAVQFLINQGVQPSRLRARGYGKSKPAIDCPCSRCTESDHQTNRRTTFRILED